MLCIAEHFHYPIQNNINWSAVVTTSVVYVAAKSD